MYPPPNGDILVTSQKEKRMKHKEKKRAKQCKKKSSTKKHVEYGEQKNNEKEPKHENRNKDLI